jgi:hypothetical protein
MAKNNYIAQRQARDRDFFEAGMRTGAQLIVDFMSQTLHDPDVMGKTRVLNRGSIEKILGHCKVLDEHFCLAFSDHVEADYIRTEWDNCLKEIYGEDTDPVEKRYPYAKEFKYIKTKKGWVD